MKPSTNDDAIQSLIAGCQFLLPDSYFEFFRSVNECEGELDIDPGWFQLWPIEELLELNEAYEVTSSLPNYFAFGSNGGGEMFAFKILNGRASSIYMIPFIPMREEDAIQIAPDFEQFKRAMQAS